MTCPLVEEGRFFTAVPHTPHTAHVPALHNKVDDDFNIPFVLYEASAINNSNVKRYGVEYHLEGWIITILYYESRTARGIIMTHIRAFLNQFVFVFVCVCLSPRGLNKDLGVNYDITR